MQKKKRYRSDSSVRAKRWRAKQGKAVLTYLDPAMAIALKAEAKRKNKAVWKLVRSAFNTETLLSPVASSSSCFTYAAKFWISDIACSKSSMSRV